MIEQLTKLNKAGNMMATTTSEAGKIVYMPVDELHAQANARNQELDQQEATRLADEAYDVETVRINSILNSNKLVSAADALFLQTKLWNGRQAWQEFAEKRATVSNSEFKIYRFATGMYDRIASWTLDKDWADSQAFNYKGEPFGHVYEKTVKIGDKVTFIGNQNGYEQYEIIA